MRFQALLAATILLAGIAVTAQAGEIELWVDHDFTTYLYNPTAADVSFDGYLIFSHAKTLDVAGWDSLNDHVADRSQELLDNLGPDSLSWGEISPNAAYVAETNLAGISVLKAGEKFAIGKPFGPSGPDWSRDQFSYNLAATPDLLASSIVPEPSTLILAALAGAGPLAFRRRAARSLRPS
jgi:hypothetical protein